MDDLVKIKVVARALEKVTKEAQQKLALNPSHMHGKEMPTTQASNGHQQSFSPFQSFANCQGPSEAWARGPARLIVLGRLRQQDAQRRVPAKLRGQGRAFR